MKKTMRALKKEGRILAWAFLGAGVFLMLALSGPPAVAADDPGGGVQAAGEAVTYPVSAFRLTYHEEKPGQVPLHALDGLQLRLGVTDAGLVAPHEATEHMVWTLGRAPEGVRALTPSAINHVCARVLQALNERGLIGVYVRVSDADVAPATGEDLRDDATLTLVIHTTTIEEVRTVAAGPRLAGDDVRINHAVHERIRERSPLQSGDVLRERELDSYVVRLSRHPRRSVSTTLAAADFPGKAVLDYVVSEDRPWLGYVQMSNTGTKSTDEWQYRFGVSHTQLTGSDDILNLDYITTDFNDVHFLLASYQVPVRWLDSNLRTYGRYNRYRATDVGGADFEFKGEGWQLGSELNWNVYQRELLFVNVYGGMRWEQTKVKQPFAGWEREPFLLPYVGVELERYTRTEQTNVSVDLERNFASIAGTSSDIERLGRLDAERSWTALKYRVRHSMFLEPLTRGDNFDNPDIPGSASLAHNLTMELTGQNAFGARLYPSAKSSVGGTHTVRGYPESVTSGDDVYVLRTEYRYHLPRAFEPSPEPGRIPLFGRPFRYAPQHVYGRADWDLALKAFFDYGRTSNNRRPGAGFEQNRTLYGTGLGAELDVLQNVKMRVEAARALRSLRGGQREVKSGNYEVHFGLTLMF